jgi:RNA polymerase sigma-70 factor (ECF subfamily)
MSKIDLSIASIRLWAIFVFVTLLGEMTTTSSTLLERLRQPNQPDAWVRFVGLYTPLLLHWASRQGLQEADAQDVVQEMLIKLVRELPAYERGDGQSFRGWLFRLTVNQCKDFRRRVATRPLPDADGLSDVSASEEEDSDDRRRLVRRALELIRGDFNETTWTAFTRLMMEGRSATDVAAELGTTANAVYLDRHRVLTRLRQELEGMLD